MCAKQWKSIVAMGDEAMLKNENDHAITYYKNALNKAEAMLEQSVFDFDGDAGILKLYSQSCRLLVNALLQGKNSSEAFYYLEHVCNKLLALIKNPAYAFELRGKAIRECEPIFAMIKSYYYNNGQPEKAIEFIGSRLNTLQTYLQQMPNLQLQIQRN